MSVTVPFPVAGTASGWQLVDYQPAVAGRSTPAVGGRAVLSVVSLDVTEMWVITHAVIECDSITSTTLRLYADQIGPTALLDGSNSGNFDVADWPSGLMLAPGCTLLAVWDDADDGAIGTLTLQARVLRRS